MENEMHTCPFRGPCLVLLAILTFIGGPPARAQPQKPRPVESKVLKSRAALAAAVGEKIARQVPVVDFQLFSLIWIKLPVDAAPAVKIVTLPADRSLRYSHSSALWMDLTRKRTVLEVAIVSDAPCSGGPRRSPKQSARCYKRLKASMDMAKKTQVLFATPRAKLRRVVATQRAAPPRP
jgi:hypothetical protein